MSNPDTDQPANRNTRPGDAQRHSGATDDDTSAADSTYCPAFDNPDEHHQVRADDEGAQVW